jgi:two-component system, OmpR family, sensor histidine kinase VicK
VGNQYNDRVVALAMDPEQLYHQAPCGYITFLPDGQIIKVNQTLLNWLGYSEDELVDKKKFGDLLSKGGQIHYEMFFRPMLKVSGTVKELSYELLTKEGTVIHVLFGAIAMKDEKKELLAINGILTDNRDRRKYEQDLLVARKRAELEKKRLSNFFMQMPAGVCVLGGVELVFELVNPLYQLLFPDRDLIGKKLLEALPEVKNQPIWDILTEVYNTGETFEGKELLIPLRRIKDGPIENRYFNFIYQARKNEFDEIDGLFVFVIEVTDLVIAREEVQESYREQQSLNEELVATNEELTTINEELSSTQSSLHNMIKNFEDSESELRKTKALLEEELEVSRLVQQQKDGFIGMASHELKTPLTSLNAILQVSNLKLKDSTDPFLSNAMARANVQVKRMTAMINGFLDISRFESGKMLLDSKKFDLDALLREMMDEIQLTTRSHIFQIDTCEKATVLADRDKIGSVITNFLGNAVKYSAAGSNIYVSCIIKNSDVKVSVKDEGIGAKPEDLEKLFDRYYRVESSQTRHIAGFGIGLYVSSEIIKQHNGRIWADSVLGKGSTFHFSLPLDI